MDASRVNQAGKEIQIHVRERCGGRPHEETRKRIYQLADDARYAAEHDGYMEEKAAGVKYFADVLYSHRKHAKYAEKHASYASRRESGIEKVQSILLSCAHSIAAWSPPRAETIS